MPSPAAVPVEDGPDRRPPGPVDRRDLRIHAPRGHGGRPRDHGATARVIAATQSLLADLGTGITVDAVASRAGVGQATIYRRWSTSSGLIADAVQAVDPLPHDPDPSGSARVRLTSLLQRLTEPLTPAELTVAAALAQAPREPELHRVMERVLLAPLQERVRAACRSSPTTDEAAVATAVAVVEGLWVRRYLLAAPPLAEAEVRAVVDAVLLPLEPRPGPPSS